jgi:hypothetical protein
MCAALALRNFLDVAQRAPDGKRGSDVRS